jgi:hypothetical protein
LIFMLPLLRGHSKSLGAFAQGLSSGVKKTIAFLTSKHKETKYEPAPLRNHYYKETAAPLAQKTISVTLSVRRPVDGSANESDQKGLIGL